MKFLELFYQKPYAEEEDFYEQFEKRREEFMHLFMCSMRSVNRSEANAGQKQQSSNEETGIKKQ